MFTDFISRVWNTLSDFFIAALMFIFVYNPVAFLLWSIFDPKHAANAATSRQFPRMEKMVKPMHYIYPFFMKKYFIKEYGLDHYSEELQRKTFFAFRERADVEEMTHLFQTMSKECYNVALFGAPSVDQKAAILADITLTADDLGLLDSCYVEKYAKKHTLTAEYLIWVFKTYHVSADETNSSKAAAWNFHAKMLLSHVERHGATKEFMDFLSKQNDEAFKESFKKALKAFSERQVVYQMCTSSIDTVEFTRYVQDNPVLEPQTQKLLRPWQLKIFLKFDRPADEAVCYLLSKGDLQIANILFKNKDVQFSEMAQALIQSNSLLLMAYIRSGRHF